MTNEQTLPDGIKIAQIYNIVDECGVVTSSHNTLHEAIWAQECAKFEKTYYSDCITNYISRHVDAEDVRHWIIDNADTVYHLLSAYTKYCESKNDK